MVRPRLGPIVRSTDTFAPNANNNNANNDDDDDDDDTHSKPFVYIQVQFKNVWSNFADMASIHSAFRWTSMEK